MSKLERRFSSTVNKPSSKPSPFSSLLSIKKRRMPGDTGLIGATGDTSDTEQPLVSEIDASFLRRTVDDAAEQAMPLGIQTQQASSALEHAVAPDFQPHQAGDTTAQASPSSIQLLQTTGITEQAVTPPIPTSEGAIDVHSHRTGDHTAAVDNTEQASVPSIELHRAVGVTSFTNPTAVRFARDPLGKRSHPGYTRMTVYVQKQTHDDFKLVADLAREEMSEIVEKLIEDYTKARKKELVRSFAG